MRIIGWLPALGLSMAVIRVSGEYQCITCDVYLIHLYHECITLCITCCLGAPPGVRGEAHVKYT